MRRSESQRTEVKHANCRQRTRVYLIVISIFNPCCSKISYKVFPTLSPCNITLFLFLKPHAYSVSVKCVHETSLCSSTKVTRPQTDWTPLGAFHYCPHLAARLVQCCLSSGHEKNIAIRRKEERGKETGCERNKDR
jgi:hypothetical protein